MVAKDLVWAIVVLTHRTKKLASLKSRAVDVKFQTKGREGNLDIP